MKKIIVFTYPFDQIERIVDYTVRFARDLGFPIEFVHAIENPTATVDPQNSDFNPMGLVSDTVPNDFVENSSRVLQKVLSIKNASMQFPVSYSYNVISGSVNSLIRETTQRNDVEMVLIPNAPDSETNKQLSLLIDHISHPVFSFPLSSEYHSIRKIIYAAGNHDKDVLILQRIAGLARKMMASVTVFNRNNNDNDKNVQLSNRLKEKIEQLSAFGRLNITEIKSDKSIREIKNLSRQNHADMVVLLKENQPSPAKSSEEGTTKELMREAGIPLLIYHVNELTA